MGTLKRPAGANTLWFWALLCCALWGSAFPCIKIGYRLFAVAQTDTATQIMFAGCRFALAGVLVIAAGSLLQRRWLIPRVSALRPVSVLACFQTIIQYLFFYVGLAHTSGVNSSIITGANACVTILVACFLFRSERFSLPKLGGCLFGFSGVLLLNLSGGVFTFTLTGEGFVLLSTVSSAISAVLIKRYSSRHDPAMLSGWQFLVGGVCLALVGLLGGGQLRPSSFAAVALLGYLAFLSAAAYTLWGLLLQRHPVSAVSIYKSSIPLFGTALSAWWLGEYGQLLRWQTPVALMLVIFGVVWLNKANGQKRE